MLVQAAFSEYERIGREPVDKTPSAVKLDQPHRRSRPPRHVRQ